MRKVLWLSSIFLLVESIYTHPFDQIRNDSSCKYLIKSNTIEFILKFPVHSYVNLWVSTRVEFDTYMENIFSSIEKSKIRNYVYKHLYAFNGKQKLEIVLKNLIFIKSDFSIRNEPEFITIKGIFIHKSKIIDLYLFNDLFKESKKNHFGTAEIEYKGKVFDFEFRKNKYFHLNLDKY